MTPVLARHLVMHGLAVKKHGTAAEVAAITGLPADIASSWLGALVAGGRAHETDGKYLLTPLARVALDGDYLRFWSDLRADSEFMRAYEQFEQINVHLKSLITDWQTMTIGGRQVPNDHHDQEYDSRLIDRLGDLHERADDLLAALEGASARFGHYRRGLAEALDRAEDGAIEWVSDARIASYHTLWFELHEDLLRIVGRQRTE